ncbi:MAG: metal-dependent hydrolase [Planctomycetota bacterium]
MLMAPGAHLVLSWLLANGARDRIADRRIIALAGLLPDLDGAGLLIDVWQGQSIGYYQLWHHRLGHNLFCLVPILLVALGWTRSWRCAALAAAAFLLHLGADAIGSGSPDGVWPLYWLWPVSGHDLAPAWQWPLNHAINVGIFGLSLVAVVLVARRHGRTPIEVFSQRADRYVLATLQGMIARWRAPRETT